jgi:hypothetical protein
MNVAAVSTVPARLGDPVVAATAGPAALLPPIEQPSAEVVRDAMTELYEILARLRDVQMDQSKGEIETAKIARAVAEREKEDALRRAREAAEEGGFFDWLAEDVGLVGVAALVTFQWHVAAADIAAHKSGVVETLGLDGLEPEVANSVAKDVLQASVLVASVAATVLTCGTTTGLCLALAGVALSAGGSKLVESRALDRVLGEGASKWIGLAMQVGGAAVSASAGFATAGQALLGTGATRGASVVQGSLAVVKGADGIVLARNEHERGLADVDVEGAKQKLGRLLAFLEMLVEGVREVRESTKNAAEALRAAIDTRDQTNVMLARATRA